MANVKAPTLFGKAGEVSLANGWQWHTRDWFVHVCPHGDGWRLLLSCNFYRAAEGKWRKSPQSAANDAERYLRRLKGQLERLGA